MYFAIRDDDVNFFTRPEDVASMYSQIWDTCPISLSVTPYQAGHPAWLFPGHAGDIAEEFPLGANRKLVEFLRDGCGSGRLAILLHGYNHDIPSGQPEFWGGDGLEEKARRGKEYIEDILETTIKCFVPPHNALSRAGIEAVVKAGMNIVGIQSFRPHRRVLRPRHIVPFLMRNWYLRVWREEYPRPLWVVDHWEIPYSSLGPLTSPKSIRTDIARAIRVKGSFCLSTHHWELGREMACRPLQTVGELFLELLELVRNDTDATFTTVDALPTCTS